MKLSTALSERIKKLMEEKGISESELIEKSKLSNTTINRLLNGSLDRILDTQIYKICPSIGYTYTRIFSRRFIIIRKYRRYEKRKIIMKYIIKNFHEYTERNTSYACIGYDR